MSSQINAAYPAAGAATTASERTNWAYAKSEIEALQAAVAVLEEEPIMDQAPIPLVAGDGAASVALDISAATGDRCVISSEGPIRVRFGATAVTLAAFHLVVPPGTTAIFTVPTTVSQMTAWGDGGAWKFCLVPLS